MLIYSDIKKSIRSLFIHRLRTLLSTLGILFGVAALITMLSIGEGAKQETLKQMTQLGMTHLVIRQPFISKDQESQIALGQRLQGLTEKDFRALKDNIPTITEITPLKVVKATLHGKLALLSPEIIATTRHYQKMQNLQLIEGRFICDRDQKENKYVCVLGYDVAKDLGNKGHIGQSLKLEKRYYQIVGVLKPTYWKKSKSQLILHRNLNRTVLIPLGSDRDLTPLSFLARNRLSEIILSIQNIRQMKESVELVKQILKKLRRGSEDYQIIVPYELIQQAYRTQHTFNWILGSIAAISLVVGGIGIMNIMLATVSERTREIGIRRAVGANRHHILMQFLLETLLLTLGGGLLGILVGIIFSFLLNFTAGWQTAVTLWSILLSLTMSLGVGVCSGLYPALQAARMDPIQALRYH